MHFIAEYRTRRLIETRPTGLLKLFQRVETILQVQVAISLILTDLTMMQLNQLVKLTNCNESVALLAMYKPQKYFYIMTVSSLLEQCPARCLVLSRIIWAC